MELDDLRRAWKQPLPTTVIDSAHLQQLVKSQPGLVENMRRNAQWELALTILVSFGLPVFIALAKVPIYRLYAAVMLLMSGVLLFYYYQKLLLLQRMTRTDGNVHGHLQTLCEGLRTLLRFYYRLTLATGPVMLLMLTGYYVGQELARPTPFRWEFIGLLIVAMLLLGALLQVAVIYGTRWYLQRLYGRHLDRLEASLRELEE
jgi:Flp pilus assembly protein TadB